MKKQLVFLGIIAIVVFVNFTGCLENSYENVNSETSKINEPDVTFSEEYKNLCQEIEVVDLMESSLKYIGNDVICRGEIVDIAYDWGYKIYKISDEYFQKEEAFYFYTYGYIYVVTDEYHNFSINDLIQVWGRVQGEYYNYNIDHRSYNYVWGFFIEKLYHKPIMSEQVEEKLCEILGWRNPTYPEMIDFIRNDRTETYEYSTNPDNIFVCANFCEKIRDNARKGGFIIGSVTLKPPEDESITIPEAHSMVCFNTTDKGLYFVEPQTDEIFTKEEMDIMQSEGMYGEMKFVNYSYRWLSCCIDMQWEWNYLQGSWAIEYNNETYIIEQQ